MKHTFETKGFIWSAVIWCALVLFIQCLPIFAEYLRIQEIEWRYFGFPRTLYSGKLLRYDSLAVVVDVIFTVVFLAATLGVVTARRFKVRLHSCTKCQYDLTANTSGTCPECGTIVTTDPAEPTQPPVE